MELITARVELIKRQDPVRTTSSALQALHRDETCWFCTQNVLTTGQVDYPRKLASSKREAPGQYLGGGFWHRVTSCASQGAGNLCALSLPAVCSMHAPPLPQQLLGKSHVDMLHMWGNYIYFAHEHIYIGVSASPYMMYYRASLEPGLEQLWCSLERRQTLSANLINHNNSSFESLLSSSP